MDWGRGRYESTAEQLLPGAKAVVEAARLQPGERVLDVGTGTGSAAFMAARAGARVVAVDPAPRLLDVARRQALTEGLEVEFAEGEAADLPVADDSCEVVLSNFAVILAADPPAVVAELVRVLVPDGRIVLSAWLPDGAMSRYAMTAQALVGEAVGMPPQPPPFPWHEQGPLTELFGAHGLEPTLTRHEITFIGSSPMGQVEADRREHPLGLAGFEVLERLGRAEAARDVLVRILSDENEDPKAFRVTQPYVVVTARRRQVEVAAGSLTT